MKIATWNVAYARGKKANQRRRAVLDEVNADVWILTETHADLAPGNGYTPFSSQERINIVNRSVVSGSSWVTIWARDALRPRRLQVTDEMRTAACSLETNRGPFWAFGTVLPWYTDRERDSVAVEVVRQRKDWLRFRSEIGPLGCVAGDFNVDLGGGRHYYGSKESKLAVQDSLDALDLVAVTDFRHTKSVQTNYGLIDHIAVSSSISSLGHPPHIWAKTDEQGEYLSDHQGVAVDLRFNDSRQSAA